MNLVVLGPATSLANAVVRIGILIFGVLGFFAAFGVSLWLGNKWFGKSRLNGLLLGALLSVWLAIMFALVQLW